MTPANFKSVQIITPIDNGCEHVKCCKNMYGDVTWCEELDSMTLITFHFIGTWPFSGRTRGKYLGREAMAWGFSKYVLLTSQYSVGWNKYRKIPGNLESRQCKNGVMFYLNKPLKL